MSAPAFAPLLPANTTSTPNRSPLTLDQLLKSPILPPPPREFSAHGSAADDEDPKPHPSTRNTGHYGSIEAGYLQMFTRKKVRKFCDFVTALSNFVTFQNDMRQPFTASTTTTEGDISAYLESQVVIPAWEAVTRMFPPSAGINDLMSKRQFYMQQGIPDLVFGSKVIGYDRSGRHLYTPRAILELKRPGIVQGLLPVFVKSLYRSQLSNLPDNWVAVTQQLRKHAITASCNHILIMDERVGIYFEFDDPDDDEESIHYLLSVPPDLLNDENRLIAPHGFTLRQLLAFMCYRAFSSVFELQTVPTPDSGTATSVSSDTYSSSLPPDVRTNNREPNLPASTPSRKQPNRRAKSFRAHPPDNTAAQFTAWIPGSTITLRMTTDAKPNTSSSTMRSRAVSKSDSGFDESMSPCHRPISTRPFNPPQPPAGKKPLCPSPISTRPFNPPQPPAGKKPLCPSPISTRPFNPPQPPAGKDTLTFAVSHVFTRAGAILVTPTGTSYVAKLFSSRNPRIARKLLDGEMAAYSAALTLQGQEIPYCYGRWSIPDAPQMSVLLTEYIQPGHTISDLRLAGSFTKINALRESAEMAVKALHAKGVRHGDLVGRNLVVSGEGEEERVVIVDFDVAKVEGREGERRRWMDSVFLKNAFRVPESEE